MKVVLKFSALLLCFVLVTWFVYQIHGTPAVGIDDANIFFTYSQNFAAGKGIVYANNPERVEGFTSFAWMLICALIFGAGFTEHTVLLASLLLLTATHMFIINLIGRQMSALGRSPFFYQLAYLLLIALSAPYMTWMTITLMDTCLWGLTLAIIAGTIISPPEKLAGWLLPAFFITTAPLVRPESMLVVPVALLLLWRRGADGNDNLCTRASKYLFAVFVLVMTVLTVFRLSYFGYPLPNTYYAKVSSSLIYNLTHGFDYLLEFVTSGIVVGLGGALLLIFLLWQVTCWRLYCTNAANSQPGSGFRNYAAFVALLLSLPVLTGGDHFAMSRFFQPVFPLLCLALLLFLVEAGRSRHSVVARLSRHGAILLILLAIIDYSFFAWSNGASLSNWRWESPLDNEFRIAEKGISLGHRLNSMFKDLPKMPGVAVIPAGGIARSYAGPIIDLLGLNNTTIAHFSGAREGMKNHASFEKKLFFEMLPDILIGTPPTSEAGSEFTNETLKGLLLEPAFVARYHYGSLTRSDADGVQLKSFFADTFLSGLKDSQRLIFAETLRFSGKNYRKFEP